jgi:N4-gp56 family major capsid protein
MSNTLNSAIASSEGYSPSTDLIYNYLNRVLLLKYREPNVFEVGATIKAPAESVKTNKIDFKKFGTIARGGKLVETDRVPINNLDNESVTMTIYEWGNGVGITEQGREFNSIDPFIEAVNELAEDARMVHTLSVRDAYYSGTNVIYGGDATGLGDIADADVFSFAMMEKLVTNARLQKLIPFSGEMGRYYIAFVHPIHQSQLISEMQTGTNNVKANLWQPVSSYAGRINIFPEEIGMYQNIRFIATPLLKQGYDATDTDTYDAALASGTANADALSGILVGKEGVGYYDKMLPQLRFDNSDFNRIQEAAWIGYWGNVMLQNQSILKFYTGTDLTASS